MTANGQPEEIALSVEQQIARAGLADTAQLLIRVGRDGSVVLSGDVITAGDDIRAYGLLEKLKHAVGQICQERQRAMESRIMPPPPGLRVS